MTDYLIDDPGVEKVFQDILRKTKLMQNGVVADSMKDRGINYKVNYGVSVVVLKQLALAYQRNHLLALKLWNKQWRETMILATMLEEPEKVSGKQIDYWVRSIENIEIAEQYVMNLISEMPEAFDKATEWCLGRKRIVKISGLILMGRLAMVDKKASDENFEDFFEVLPPLSKDPSLSRIIFRSLMQIGMKNINLNELTLFFAKTLKTSDSVVAKELADQLIEELTSDEVFEIVKKRSIRTTNTN
jgi:hypothetical protein